MFGAKQKRPIKLVMQKERANFFFASLELLEGTIKYCPRQGFKLLLQPKFNTHAVYCIKLRVYVQYKYYVYGTLHMYTVMCIQ